MGKDIGDRRAQRANVPPAPDLLPMPARGCRAHPGPSARQTLPRPARGCRAYPAPRRPDRRCRGLHRKGCRPHPAAEAPGLDAEARVRTSCRRPSPRRRPAKARTGCRSQPVPVARGRAAEARTGCRSQPAPVARGRAAEARTGCRPQPAPADELPRPAARAAEARTVGCRALLVPRRPSPDVRPRPARALLVPGAKVNLKDRRGCRHPTRTPDARGNLNDLRRNCYKLQERGP